SGARFAGWADDCSGQTDCTLNIDATRIVTALFYQQYTLDVKFNGNGHGTVLGCSADCSLTLDAGTTEVPYPSPAADSSFDGWSGACTGSVWSSCSFVMDGNKTLGVSFLLGHELTLTVQPGLDGATGKVTTPAG